MPGNLKPDLPLFAFVTITAADCRTSKERQAGNNQKPWHEAKTCQMSLHRIARSVVTMPDLEPGALVILTRAPSSLLQGLPKEDQKAILSIVGRPVTLAGFSYGQAELEFTDAQGDDHTIWVGKSLIRPA